MAKALATSCDRCKKETLGYPSSWGTVRVTRGVPFLDTAALDICDACVSTIYNVVRRQQNPPPPLTQAFTGKFTSSTEDRELVLVHTDGASCYGMRIINDKCVGCGIAPDMQSTECWPPEKVIK